MQERLEERFWKFWFDNFELGHQNPYWAWLPLVSMLRTERREEVISLGHCFSVQNQPQAMQINLAA